MLSIRQTAPTLAPCDKDLLFAKYPWLRERVEGSAHRSKSGGSSSAGQPDDKSDAYQSQEEAIEKAWQELFVKRAEHAKVAGSNGDFVTKILGGAWTQVHKHKAFDAVVAVARGGVANSWCRT